MRNYYQILGVKSNATTEDIEKSYQILKKQMHPQKNSHKPTANFSYSILNYAYEILSDPEKRKIYNQSLRRHAPKISDLGSYFDPYFFYKPQSRRKVLLNEMIVNNKLNIRNFLELVIRDNLCPSIHNFIYPEGFEIEENFFEHKDGICADKNLIEYGSVFYLNLQNFDNQNFFQQFKNIISKIYEEFGSVLKDRLKNDKVVIIKDKNSATIDQFIHQTPAKLILPNEDPKQAELVEYECSLMKLSYMLRKYIGRNDEKYKTMLFIDNLPNNLYTEHLNFLLKFLKSTLNNDNKPFLTFITSHSENVLQSFNAIQLPKLYYTPSDMTDNLTLSC